MVPDAWCQMRGAWRADTLPAKKGPRTNAKALSSAAELAAAAAATTSAALGHSDESTAGSGTTGTGCRPAAGSSASAGSAGCGGLTARGAVEVARSTNRWCRRSAVAVGALALGIRALGAALGAAL